MLLIWIDNGHWTVQNFDYITEQQWEKDLM